MARYAAFLRGINVGGRRVKNDDLRTAIEHLGFEDVAIFRASGNVILEGRRASAVKLAGRLEEGLEEALGYEVRTFVRTGAQVHAIAEHEPFTARQLAGSKGKVQVTLLAKKPDAAVREEVLDAAGEDDLLAFDETELYWLPKAGTQESALGQEKLAKLFGSATMRTQGTIQAIAAKYFDR